MRAFKIISISALFFVLFSSRTSAAEEEVQEVASLEKTDSNMEGRLTCIANKCNQSCRKSGNISGACKNNRCICRKRRSADDILGRVVEIERPEQFDAGENEPKRCNFWTCRSECRESGHRGGFCWRDECRCHGDAGSENIVPRVKLSTEFFEAYEDKEAQQSQCQHRTCKIDCRQSGHRTGYCRRNECQCVGNKPEDIQPFAGQIEGDEYYVADDERQSSVLVNDIEGRARCVKRTCETHCRKTEGKGGYCNAGKCTCRK